MIRRFDNNNFTGYCNELASRDADLEKIILQYGYPPLWYRKPGFETLIHIILEQQVSLASAKAALDKLKRKTGTVTPEKILALNDEEMRACYFSRQKMMYARHLATAITLKKFSVSRLKNLDDEAVRTAMKKMKGIGDWTADVFMMMALQRSDLFPAGDIALIKSIRQVKHLAPNCSREDILVIAGTWRPYRTIAAYLLWHNYLSQGSTKS